MAESPEGIRDFLEGPTVKICHNTKFETEVCQMVGITLGGLIHDTKLMAAVLGYDNTGLKSLSSTVLGVKQLTLDDVRKGRPTAEVTPEEWLPYAAADSDMTFRLYHALMEEFDA